MKGLLLALWLLVPTSAAARVLDDFDAVGDWTASASDQVSASLRDAGGTVCLDYDFGGVSGHAAMRRRLPIDYPANYAFDFAVSGAGPANQFELKLVDASGENVWWVARPRTTFAPVAEQRRYRKRHITPAWGPLADKTLRRTEFVEFTVYANEGGRGSMCLDDLAFVELPVPPAEWPAPRAKRKGDTLTLDFGAPRELGGFELANPPRAYDVSVSDDGKAWRTLRRIERSVPSVPRDFVALGELEARYLRLRSKQRIAARDVVIRDIDFGAKPNALFDSVARHVGKRYFPRGYSGEQTYWTLVGIDGGAESALLSEDGALEVARGGFSIAPFVVERGETRAWPDVAVTQSLRDGYLPMPSVTWTAPGWTLTTSAFAAGSRDASRLVARYTLRNTDSKPRDLTLALVVQPFQVNPPVQFLTTPGGVSPIHALGIDAGRVRVDGRERVLALNAPDAAFATAFVDGMAPTRLVDPPRETNVVDATGHASGAMLYRIELAPGASRDIALDIPLSGTPEPLTRDGVAALGDAIANDWRDTLDAVRLTVPKEAQPIADTLRTAFAHILVSRDGARIRPGTRSYARSWIRDGAMTSEALLRLGRADAARAFLEWYAPFQFANGKVPCCVDARGSDPVPENDSHGELVFLANEVVRYTGDRALAERVWPHVDRATRYMTALRATEKTGLLPPSISHEGYSAKPAYSYWDDFWGLVGYKHAAALAHRLDKREDAARLDAEAASFRRAILDSIEASGNTHGIDFIPGAYDLGDFDATSTTIALSPGGELAHLPRARLEATFARYWREFEQRRDGARVWKDYTPYEWRNVAAFVRLGWRERAHEAIAFFFGDRRPAAWNQWAEVVGRLPRESRFIGDMPHGWVASDFIRSVLDLFAYEADGSLVLAAGIPLRWLDEPFGIAGLHTPYGPLDWRMSRAGSKVRVEIGAITMPPNGIFIAWPYGVEPVVARADEAFVRREGDRLRVLRTPLDVTVGEGLDALD